MATPHRRSILILFEIISLVRDYLSWPCLLLSINHLALNTQEGWIDVMDSGQSRGLSPSHTLPTTFTTLSYEHHQGRPSTGTERLLVECSFHAFLQSVWSGHYPHPFHLDHHLSLLLAVWERPSHDGKFSCPRPV